MAARPPFGGPRAAELVVSELVTNNIRHARDPRGHVIRTHFERLGCGVRIEVHGANESKSEQRKAFDDEESGRGLALVDAITGGRWGVGDREGVGADAFRRPRREGPQVADGVGRVGRRGLQVA